MEGAPATNNDSTEAPPPGKSSNSDNNNVEGASTADNNSGAPPTRISPVNNPQGINPQTTIPPTTRPLSLPEIRIRIAQFLEIKDCISCMCVSRDWSNDFVWRIWYKVDFSKERHLAALNPNMLYIHGALIKQVSHLSTFEHVRALQHPRVDSIRSLDVHFTDDRHYRELVADLLRRCKGDITDLTISCSPSEPDNVVEQRNHGNHFIQVNTLISYPMSPRSSAVGYGVSLHYLSMNRVCLTREGFSALLRYSPVLRKLKLFHVVVLEYNPAFELSRESSVTSLEAPLGEVWMPDSEMSSAPSLLAHLPLLEEWIFTSLDQPSNWNKDTASQQVADCCPFLNTLRFSHATTDNLSDLLLDCFQLVEACTFSAKNLETVTTIACINHMQTLTSVTIADELAEPDSPVMKWLYFIPKLCLHLEYLSIEKLALDIGTVKRHHWSCRDLRELRVRFKGLESGEDIGRCAKQVYAWRQTGSMLPVDGTIVSRVSHYLIQFTQLSVVWMGTKDYFLPL
ncbi:hypothetical protein BGW39_009108 [Mortierella sp. 14UC]|nr:hypothetical protein BGW39_009108 [Mortierella sp. 14UC]